jgi:HEAT repeat protein
MMRRSGLLASVVITCGIIGLSTPALGADKKDETVEELLSKVAIGTLSERLEALQGITQLRDMKQIREWKIVELLMELSKDDNPRVARRAVKGMGDLVMGAERGLKDQVRTPIIKILRDAKRFPLVRSEAARQLGRLLTAGDFADAEGVTALIRIANAEVTKAPEVAAACIIAVGDIGDRKGKELIRERLNSRDTMVQEAALEALEKFLTGRHAKDIVDASLGDLLLRLLSNPRLTPEGKERILQAVGLAVKNGTPKARAEAALLRVLDAEKKESTLVAGLKALAFAGTPKCVKTLVALFERFSKPGEDGADVGMKVRAQVCSTIGELFDAWGRSRTLDGAGGAARLLCELLTGAMISDKADSVKKEAIVSLGNLYDRKYDRLKPVAALIALLAETTGEDRQNMIVESLEVLTGRSFGADAERWERWFGKNQRKLMPSRR